MSRLEPLDPRQACPTEGALQRWTLVRGTAALGTLVALAYALWMSWTALAWSTGAPAEWRMHLLLLEGGLPLLFAMGFGYAAWGPPQQRRLGWGVVGLVVLGLVLWTWYVQISSDSTLVTGAAVLTPPLLLATLDPDHRAALIEQLYRQYSAPLIAFGQRACARAGLDPSLAEDLLHDLFAACADPAGGHDEALQRPPHRVKAWLYKGLSQRLSTRWRSDQRRDAHETDATWTALVLVPSPAAVYEDRELQTVIDATLAAAPPRAVQAYRLVREEGLTHAEAGDVMGITAGAVGAHLTTIAQRLRPALADWWTTAAAA